MEGEGNMFLRKINSKLGDPEQVLNCMKEDETEMIGAVAWELTGSIMTFLKDNVVSDQLDVYEKCFTRIATLSPAKALYLGVLEHFDPCADSRHVEILMPAVSVILNKLCDEDHDACAVVLETTYSTLSYYIESLNVPDYEDFDPSSKSKECFEAAKILRFTEKYVAAVEPVITDLCLNTGKVLDFGKFRKHTFQFLCNLLVNLAQLDLDVSLPVEENFKKLSGEIVGIEGMQEILHPSVVHPVAYDIFKMVVLFHSPAALWSVMDWFSIHPAEERSAASRAEISKQVERGRACFLFLLLCRNVLYDRFPKVFSSQCLLVQASPSLIALLSCKNQAVVWKGLEMLSHVIDRTTLSSISHAEVLYNIQRLYKVNETNKNIQNHIVTIFQHLVHIAIMLPSKIVRTRAIQHVTSLLDTFLWEDKHILLVRLLKISQHAGVRGVLIGFLKDKLSQILQISPPENSSTFCDKHKMQNLGEMIFMLPESTETDLLEDCDRLMPALNLLRFILIRDKTNRTGILDNLSMIHNGFLKPLRSAIDLSRAHYENELKKYRKNTSEKQNTGTEFVVNGTPLPTLPYHEQKNTLQAALHTFDMIEVVTVRVVELIETSHGG